MKKSIRPWLVLAASFLMLFTTIGLGSNGISLLYIPVAESLNFSQAKFSLYYTFSTFAGLVAAPVAGKILSKNYSKIRLFIIIGGFANMLCFVGYSFCRTLPAFYIASILRGFSGSLISATPATMLINAWFVDKRNTATSIAFMGSSFGGLAYTQISRALLNAYGWQTAYWAMGVISFITIVIVVILAVPTPEQVGEKPFGYEKLAAAGGESKAENWQGLTAGEAMKTPAMWLLCIAMFMTAVVVMGVQQCAASAVRLDFGHSEAVAANVVSVMMIAICVGKLIVGWIFDNLSVKKGLLYSTVLIVVSMVCMVFAKSTALAFAFAAIFGLGNVNTTVTSTTMTSTTFGTKEYGTIYGTVTMFMSGGMAVGPVISGAFYDGLGSYKGAWILYAVMSVVAIVILFIVNNMSKKLKEKYPV